MTASEDTKPIFLNDVLNYCDREGFPDVSEEIADASDIDPVILEIHRGILSAGGDAMQHFQKLGFELEPRGQYGEMGELSMTDPGGPTLARFMGEDLSPGVKGLLAYLRDIESGVRLVEMDLARQNKGPDRLHDFLIKTGLYPQGTDFSGFEEPIPVQVPFQDFQIRIVVAALERRWATESKLKKAGPKLDDARRASFTDSPTPLQVASLFTRFIGGDWSEIAGKSTYEDAVWAGLQVFHITGLKLTPGEILSDRTGMYPVPEGVIPEERPLRERVGRDLSTAFTLEDDLRDHLARVSARRLSLQELGYIRRASFQNGYDDHPLMAVYRVVSGWLQNRGVMAPKEFLDAGGINEETLLSPLVPPSTPRGK